MPAGPTEFFVDYDDFSGGMFVGSNDAKMPKNTFSGANMVTCEVDGTLMPASSWVPRSDAGAGSALTAAGKAVAYMDSGFNFVFAANFAGTGIIRETIDGDATHHPWDIATPAARFSNAAATSGLQGFARMGPYNVWFGSGIAWLFNQSLSSLFSVTTPTTLSGPTTFGEFVVGRVGNQLFWCNPGDPQTWPAASFLTVGSNAYSITSLVVLGDTLMVGRQDGWWRITGVLGQNETLVQVSTEGTQGYGAVTADGALSFPGRLFDGSSVRVLRGSVVSAFAFLASVLPTTNNCYTDGGFLVALGAGSDMMVRSPTGRWAYMSVAHQPGGFFAFSDSPPDHPFAYAWLATGASTAAPYRMLMGPINPPMNGAGAAFNTATATLADYKRTTKFRVKSVIAELDLGATTIDAQRSIGVRIQTPGQVAERPLSAVEFADAGSTTQTVVLPAVASTAGERITLRFSPTDGQDTYTMIPQITLQGVKLRRLLVHCIEVPS